MQHLDKVNFQQKETNIIIQMTVEWFMLLETFNLLMTPAVDGPSELWTEHLDDGKKCNQVSLNECTLVMIS